MQYRLNKATLLEELKAWNSFLKRKVSLIACGGTALTLLNIKESTKDVDFIVPDIREYNYLIRILSDLGYKLKTGYGWARNNKYIFDLYQGDKIFTTSLIESPLKEGNNIAVKEFSYIYLGVLNFYDIIISKLFRGTTVDFNDCLLLAEVKRDQIDLEKLRKRFLETSLYEVSETKVNKNLDLFFKRLKGKK